MLIGSPFPGRPYHSAVILLASTSAALYGLSRWFPNLLSQPPPLSPPLQRASSGEIELEESRELISSPQTSLPQPSPRRSPRFTIAIASVLIVARVELWRHIQGHMECSTSGFLVYILEASTFFRHELRS